MIVICKLFYNSNQICTTLEHSLGFCFDLTNDLIMYRLAELASYLENPPTCTSIIAIEPIECSRRFLGPFKCSSTQKLLGPPLPPSVSAIVVSLCQLQAQPDLTAPSNIFPFGRQQLIFSYLGCSQVLNSGAWELLPARTWFPNAPPRTPSSKFINV